MGACSQIYIRGKVEEGYDLIALHYQWNTREQMISRAAQIIDSMKREKRYISCMDDLSSFNLVSIADLDFDCKNVESHIDIKEKTIGMLPPTATLEEINKALFIEQDTQCGQLYVDISEEEIKYAFIENHEEQKVLNAKEYLTRNVLAGYLNEGLTVEDPEDWITAYQIDKHTDEKEKKRITRYTTKNMKIIDKNSSVMTQEELTDFLTADYKIKPTGKGFFDSLYKNMEEPYRFNIIFQNHFGNYQFEIPESVDIEKLKKGIMTALKKYRIYDDSSYAEVENEIKTFVEDLTGEKLTK